MARKRYSDEDVLKLLREIELKLADGSDVQSACRGVGVSDATYYNLRKRFGGMGKSRLAELGSLEKENARLKKIVAELELDKLDPSPLNAATESGRMSCSKEKSDGCEAIQTRGDNLEAASG